MQITANLALLERLQAARQQTDRLLQMVDPSALYDRPIPERHRLIFYAGHLEAFDWNMVCRGELGMKSFNSEFDQLFAFGIDPGPDSLPTDLESEWPTLEQVEQYRSATRNAVDFALEQAKDLWTFRLVLEHRLMHAETLTYLIHRLPADRKIASVSTVEDGPEPPARAIDIPAGEVTLGRDRSRAGTFGWDNEFCAETVGCPAFSMDVHNVTNGQFLAFVRAGGYQERSLWSEDGWRWVQQSGTHHPNFWKDSPKGWMYQTMFEQVPLSLSWPVYVTHAEAAAYARWKEKALPTEVQYHRAAFGTRTEQERAFPWGNVLPTPEVQGNFGASRWNPRPVGSYAEGWSAFGVADLMSNGWEWTSSPFAPLRGFVPFRLYPGYSANFFDGKHYVLKGASPVTSVPFLRRTFRNWFQPNYPNVYATFRCVEN